MPPKQIKARKTPDAAELHRQAKARPSKQTDSAQAVTEAHAQRLVHELEMQNDELAKSRADLEAALSQYTDLYDFAPVGYFTLARDGTIQQVNLAGAHQLGAERGALINRRFGLFVAPESLPIFSAFFEKVSNSQEKETCEVALLKSGDELLWAHIEAISLEDGQLEAYRCVVVDITERKQAEESLRRSEERFRSWIDNSSDLISVVDLQGLIRYQSPSVQRLLGYGQEELVGQSAFDFIHPDDAERISEMFAVNTQTPEATASAEFRFRHHDGSWRVLEGTGKAYVDEHGEAMGLINSRDVTERKHAEETLLLQTTALNSAANAIVITDPDGTIEWINPAVTAMTGYSWAEAIGKNPRELLKSGKQDAAFYQDLWDTILAGNVWHGELINRRKDGSLYSEEQTITPLTNADGKVTHFIAIEREITGRKQAEATLRQSERRYRLLFDSNPMPMWVYDLETLRFLAANDAAVAHYGYSRDEFLGMTIRDIRLAEELPRLEANLARRPGELEKSRGWKHRKKDGTVIEVEIISHEIEFAGRPSRLVLANDITERKQAEAALAQSSDMLSRAEQIGHIGSWELNLATNREVWSDGQYRLLGLRPQDTEATYETYLDRVHPEDRDEVRLTIDRGIRDNEPIEYECRIVRPGGSQRIIYAKTGMASDDRGEPARKIGIAIDITERKERERQLEAVAAVSTALRSATTRAEIEPIILDEVMSLLDVDAAALSLVDPRSGELVVHLGRGEMAGLAGRRLPADAGISGHVIDTVQPYVTNDTAADPFFVQFYPIDAARAVACLPLITRQQVFGVLWAGRVRPFEAEEVRVLTAIADMAGSALQRAELYEQTENRLQQLTALRAIDRAISASLDLRVTLSVLLDQVITQLHADAADVLLLNPHTRTLAYSAGRGMRGKDAEHFSLRLGQGYAGRVALERRRLSLPDLALAEPDPSREWLLKGEAVRAYHGVPLIAKGAVLGVLEVYHRAPLAADSEWLEFLEALAGQAAIAIDNTQLFNDLQRSNTELALAYDATIEGWSRALDLRDKETEGHTQRVTEMTLELAHSMGMGDEDMVHIRRGALLHDIGKMGVPDSILLKPGPLTEDEWLVMKKHPTFAYEMLAPIHYLRSALDIPYCHHEKLDGTGYPRGLKGDEIPLPARIFAVVDVWDALTSDRPYRAAWPADQVLEHIRSLAGTHFDPKIARLALMSGVLVRHEPG